MDLTAFAGDMTSTKSSVRPNPGIGVSAQLPVNKNAGLLFGVNYGFESHFENNNIAQISLLKTGLYGRTGRFYAEFGLNYSFWKLTSATTIYGKPGYQVIAGFLLTENISLGAKYLVLNSYMPVDPPVSSGGKTISSVDFRASQALLCLTLMN